MYFRQNDFPFQSCLKDHVPTGDLPPRVASLAGAEGSEVGSRRDSNWRTTRSMECGEPDLSVLCLDNCHQEHQPSYEEGFSHPVTLRHIFERSSPCLEGKNDGMVGAVERTDMAEGQLWG